MQWEGQQLQDGNRWLRRTAQLGLSAGYVPRVGLFVVALKTTWAHLRLQIPAAAAANGVATAVLHRWLGAAAGLGVGGSPWVSVGDLSSFCCSLGFHAGGCSQPPGADRTFGSFLGAGLWLQIHLLPNLSQQTLSCFSPFLHTCKGSSQTRVPHPPPLPRGTRHSDMG